MLKQPRSSGPYARPYVECYNTESIYTTGYSNRVGGELTDAEIDALCIAEESAMPFDNDTHADLVGDDYADAIMADLGMSSDQALFGMYN